MGKFDEKRRCPPNGGAAHIREQTLPPLAKSRGYAPVKYTSLFARIGTGSFTKLDKKGSGQKCDIF